MSVASPRGMQILLFYGSTHGHTAKIAERIATRLREHGADVTVTDRPRALRLDRFDAFVVGGRVHGGLYPWRVMHFILRHRTALASRPSAFFSVSLLQLARSATQRDRTARLPARLLPKLGWKPDRTEVVAGALRWKAQYGALAPVFKRMWRHTLGERVDPQLAEQVFTDWAQVDRFADAVLAAARRTSMHPQVTRTGAERARTVLER